MANTDHENSRRHIGAERPLGNGLPIYAEGPSISSELFDVSQLFAAIRKQLRFVLGVAATVFCLVMLATCFSRMSFRTSGRLYLGELDSKARATAQISSELDLTGSGQGQVGSEIEIIRSRSLITRAVLASGLNVSLTPAGQGPPRYLSWLLSRRDPARLDVGLSELRALDTSISDRAGHAAPFKVRFVGASEYEVWSEQRFRGRGTLGTPFKNSELSLTLVRGTERGPRSGSEFDVLVRPLNEVADDVLDVLRVTAPKDSAAGDPVNVVSLEFKDASPYLSAAFLEQLMLAYLKERQAWKTEDAAAAEAFVSTQLQGMKESLEQVQKKLADYRSNNRVVVLDNEAKAMIEQIGKYEEQRLAARLQVAALANVKKSLSGPNPPMGAFLLGEANDTVLESMATSLSEARAKLTDLETRFSAAAPDVREQRARVDAELEAIRNYLSSRSLRAQESLGTLGGIIKQFEEKLKTVPGAELGLAQLARESEVYSKTYSYLLERQQQTSIIKASTLSKNRILDAPQVPLREDSPKLPLRLASLLGGVLLGAAVVAIRSMLAGTFQSEGDVRKSVGQLPILGVLPRRPKRREVVEPTSSKLTADDTAFLEAFRAVRTNLYAFLPNHRGQIVLLTSPTSGDGKTACVDSLASVLAADGKRVLIVDANLRRPQRADDAAPDEPGLRDVLTGQSQWRDLLHRISTPLGRFYALRSGRADRPELLSSEQMDRFLLDARANFDFVLIDPPSFPTFSDALVLARAVDCVLTVLRLGHTPRKLAVDHLRALGAAARSIAILVNQVGTARGPGFATALSAQAVHLRTLDDGEPAPPIERRLKSAPRASGA